MQIRLRSTVVSRPVSIFPSSSDLWITDGSFSLIQTAFFEPLAIRPNYDAALGTGVSTSNVA
jgi:hypothetical protein